MALGKLFQDILSSESSWTSKVQKCFFLLLSNKVVTVNLSDMVFTVLLSKLFRVVSVEASRQKRVKSFKKSSQKSIQKLAIYRLKGSPFRLNRYSKNILHYHGKSFRMPSVTQRVKDRFYEHRRC